MIYFIAIIILIIIAWYLTHKIELHSEGKYSPTTLDRPFFYGLISIFIWPTFFISFFVTATVVIPLLMVIPQKRMLPIARFFSYFILFSSGVHLITNHFLIVSFLLQWPINLSLLRERRTNSSYPFGVLS